MAIATFDFTDQVVVVTGGSRGVGAGIVAAFLAAGARVVTCGRTEATVPGAHFVQADIRQPDQAAAVMVAAVETYGRLDVLVNNAGGSPKVMADVASPRFIEAIVGLNLLAPFYCAQAAYKVMHLQPEGGAIVNVGSISGLRPSPGTAAYGAAKAGLINLTATLAMEWAPAVRVNCVSAGLLRTDDGEGHYGGPEGLARMAATVPMGRMGEPDDVAQACLFLASPQSSYVSGSNLVLHGGGEWPPFHSEVTETTPT
ncbi:MAG TPA: SDR family oxidoreductase [Acidimicrobiales bacterium]|jgi:NAD(P)-dependent dehydrogenase (short-subunit alcohol dehydrogenase family)|nr:SDR family oxidoreductase [Acidimicrobiales bacterium]